MNLCLVEQNEKLWLYQVEEAVLMVEVKPTAETIEFSSKPIGQVVLKRLISAEQAIERLSSSPSLANRLSSD